MFKEQEHPHVAGAAYKTSISSEAIENVVPDHKTTKDVYKRQPYSSSST